MMKYQQNDVNALNEMLNINRKQKAFYEPKALSLESQGNVATRIWRKFRWRLQNVRRTIGIDEQIYALHWQWLGDLSDKSVLDLGCYSGNILSLQIAEQCRSYLGIDLSETAIDELNRKLVEKKIPNAKAEAIDFLSPEFGDKKYDIIYAHSVMHHFKYFEVFLEKLAVHLTPGGRIITYDPMQTSPVVKMARKMYRPFQSDGEWEWPFDKASFEKIKKQFNISEIQGVMGYTKWALLLSPFSEKASVKMGEKWHAADFTLAREFNRRLWSCMQVSLCLENKNKSKAVKQKDR